MTKKRLSRRDFLKQTGLLFGGAAILAACAPVTTPAPSGETAAETQAEEPGEAPPAEEVTLTFGLTWGAAFQGRQAEFNDQFMERHPNIKTEITYNTWSDHNRVVPTWAAADNLPDIIYVHGSRAFPWNFEGVIVSLQSFLDGDPEFDVGGIWEEALRLYNFKGEQYEIPYDHGPIILGYNKNLFDEAGEAYPDETWTMDTFRDAAIKMTDTEAQIPQWGWSGAYPNFGNEAYPACLGPWGGDVFNEDETALILDSDETRQALQFWVDLIHVDMAGPTTAESQAFEQGPWLSGRIAMSQVASWDTPSLDQFAPFEWDVAPWPEGPVGRKTGSFGSGFGITRNSTHPDAGWTYLREYLSKEGMEFMWGETGRGSPARKAAYDSWLNSEPAPEHAAYFMTALEEYAITGGPFQTLAAAEIKDIMDREIGLLRSADKTVDEAIQAILTDGTPVLDDAAERLRNS